MESCENFRTEEFLCIYLFLTSETSGVAESEFDQFKSPDSLNPILVRGIAFNE
jgi:hypothetical protein